MASLKCYSFFSLTLLLLSIASEATEFLVGGEDNAWNVPSGAKDSLNQWAAANRFEIDDYLVWKYNASKDSVLQVTRESYLSCSRSSPIAEHKDGATVVKLERSGPYYFISGADGACEAGEKLIVVVLAEKHSRHRLAPAPSPAESGSPASAPMSGASQMAALKGGLAGAVMTLGTLLLL